MWPESLDCSMCRNNPDKSIHIVLEAKKGKINNPENAEKNMEVR